MISAQCGKCARKKNRVRCRIEILFNGKESRYKWIERTTYDYMWSVYPIERKKWNKLKICTILVTLSSYIARRTYVDTWLGLNHARPSFRIVRSVLCCVLLGWVCFTSPLPLSLPLSPLSFHFGCRLALVHVMCFIPLRISHEKKLLMRFQRYTLRPIRTYRDKFSLYILQCAETPRPFIMCSVWTPPNTASGIAAWLVEN